MNTNSNSNSNSNQTTKQLSLNLQSRQPQLDYTIMRSGIRFYTEKCASIPSPVVESEFAEYHLLYWSIKHTYHRILGGNINHSGNVYRVVYRNCNRGTLLSAINNDKGHWQCSLSFRAPKGNWNIDPVVIISIDGTL